MRFRKIHGAGNDFVLLSDPTPNAEKNWSKGAERLCARRTGVGADGLVISSLISISPVVLEVGCFNADGSVATMCGNALQCTAWAAHHDHGFREMTLRMAGVTHEAIVSDDSVWVTAEVGAIHPRRVQTVINGRPTWFDSAHTGTEHVVAVVNDVDAIDAVFVGRLVRHHADLAPLGTNVNFVQAAGHQTLKIRTYERGVEAETLSCGSGAVAAVVIATLRGLVSARAVTVHNRAGEPLTVRPHPDRPKRTHWVGGPVTHTFEGVLS
ncbi:diaminopimelate epimerase [Streptomyces sp. LBUM 1478]|uniref:diaminopimelate epimerase n=1 Tax=Streptomyces scabiei TaxID=1930 RepID=UPI000765F2FF|nr:MULTISPECIES: diaminopimelate epimerase [Streptomyces]MBP5868723.1 diaminopimelate epimerase [Streptomyces sp. LBUM 1485]MBP5907258.1 diaminopimelate epimerase [Streptomyces sp. LBUM 1478]MBP5929882.1 diaminopimelate epimerase [Streptomyces sp. LBUM 1479]MBP5915354.1 diaminopimelate epimerase [Streptomyces sp. LBUM 1486]MDX2535758.1 diaminopimelate epimerase [Streptomyces scabiei]